MCFGNLSPIASRTSRSDLPTRSLAAANPLRSGTVSKSQTMTFAFIPTESFRRQYRTCVFTPMLPGKGSDHSTRNLPDLREEIGQVTGCKQTHMLKLKATGGYHFDSPGVSSPLSPTPLKN